MANLKKIGDWISASKLRVGDMVWYHGDEGFRVLISRVKEGRYFTMAWVARDGGVRYGRVRAEEDEPVFFVVS